MARGKWGTSPVCEHVGCDDAAHARGMCRTHYMQEYRRERNERRAERQCGWDGCTSTRAKRSLWCDLHHSAWQTRWNQADAA